MYAEVVMVKSIMSNTIQEIDTKEEGEEGVVWSTWEELLLAFAVKRHGLNDWDTVATELQNRHHHHHRGGSGSSWPSSAAFTAQICKDRYRNLKRRFTNNHHHHHDGSSEGGGAGSSVNDDDSKFQSDDDDEHDGGSGGGGGGGGDDAFPWLEELRKLRVAELRQEVHRHDASIRSLQIKVKTMEEERENNLKSSDRNDDVKQREPDLDDEEVKREGSENDKITDSGGKETPPAEVAGKSVSGSAGDAENISFNESNSAGNRGAFLKTEPETEPVEQKPDPRVKPTGVGREDSCNDSSDRHEVYKKKKKITQVKEKNVGRSDSDESKEEGTKESSDVQSSASLLTDNKRKKKGERDGGGIGTTDPIKRERGKSSGGGKLEPSAVFSLLDKIRGHKLGSVFERRLQIQKTEKYKKTIRRHVDLETIQSRIDDGSYFSCPDRFYVDLLLLFNNAIVYFPKASSQSVAAQELRGLVVKEMKKNNINNKASTSSEPRRPVKLDDNPERSDSLPPRNKPTNPPIVVVCRKRSSISSAKSSVANKVEKQKENEKPFANSKPVKSPSSTSDEEDESPKLKLKEKPVTGTRSQRRGSQARTMVGHKTEPSSNVSSVKNLNTSQQHGVKDKGDNKKKSEAAVTTTKKGSAADFLKRMKKNSPAKGTVEETSKNSKENNAKGGKKDQQQKKKVDEGKDGPARRSGAGGKRQIKEEISPSKRNTGRPTRKGKEVVPTGKKRGRDDDGEGSSQRVKKRAR
ncbi:OLC1v1001653C1 [Oldenlandia corymbosa var. corymbosa]|uniref:OLC1v1001653C1 n=1 Tax=Oldenlandia corymbosa var. corymbosa TaxID=529605 RepID=A0AAV1D607_OLDCO|nr:OLC1v1001653C1 [Oldenlandia corymbosa var. corymbosa]